jgi:hypothetical protein
MQTFKIHYLQLVVATGVLLQGSTEAWEELWDTSSVVHQVSKSVQHWTFLLHLFKRHTLICFCNTNPMVHQHQLGRSFHVHMVEEFYLNQQ